MGITPVAVESKKNGEQERIKGIGFNYGQGIYPGLRDSVRALHKV